MLVVSMLFLNYSIFVNLVELQISVQIINERTDDRLFVYCLGGKTVISLTWTKISRQKCVYTIHTHTIGNLLRFDRPFQAFSALFIGWSNFILQYKNHVRQT